MNDAIVSVKLSKYTSVYLIVLEAQKIIYLLPEKYLLDCNGQPVANVYVASALDSSTRIGWNPWSKNYPTKSEVIATILRDTKVEVILN